MADAELQRASPEALAIFMDMMFAFARTFNIACDADDLTEAYTETLRDLPSDLLMKAGLSVRKYWKWGNRMPLPAEIREYVATDFSARHRRRRELQLAAYLHSKSPQSTSIQQIENMPVLKISDQRRQAPQPIAGFDPTTGRITCVRN